MKIIVINPDLRTICEHNVADSFNDGKRISGMDIATPAVEFPRATLMVDDEGLLKAGNPVFEINPPDALYAHQGMFCGAAFIMGHDHDHDKNLDCPYTLDEVKKFVRWTNKVAIG